MGKVLLAPLLIPQLRVRRTRGPRALASFLVPATLSSPQAWGREKGGTQGKEGGLGDALGTPAWPSSWV